MMGVLIDEVYTEVSNQRGETPREDRPQVESACIMDKESEKMLCDQITRLIKRQLRLAAD
jgi:hypothetical protein